MTDVPISKLTAASAYTGDELTIISQLSTTVTMTATTLSAAAADNSYNDSANQFIAEGFGVGDRVRVRGFTGNTANNILSGEITALTAGKMTIGGTDGDVIVDDAAGESVTIAKWVSRRKHAGSGLIGVQTITATGAGTYTPTDGTTSVIIELVGGGAGGSGVAQPTGTNVQAGAAGGAGGYLRKRLTAAFSGASYVVGAKGTGGSAGANAGNVGSDTTFTATGGGTVYTAAGGSGGPTGTATAAPRHSGRAVGGAATNGDINMEGSHSEAGTALSTSSAVGGTGGRSMMGGGGRGGIVLSVNSSSAGANAGGYGGGGGGGAATGTGAAVAGGNGSDGVIIIWEYA